MKIQHFSLPSCVGLIAVCSLFFVSCNQEETVKTGLITFEDIALDSTGYWNGSDLSGSYSTYESWGSQVNKYTGSFSTGILTCTNIFEDYGFGMTSWSGMACSNHTNMDTAGYTNQYSVYATTGANGSEKFGLVYGDGATCQFDQPVTVNSLMLNNSTYAYLALKNGDAGEGSVRQFTANDYFYVTIKGFDADSVETGSINVYLADFRDGKSFICENWTNVSLEALGVVKTLTFSFTTTDTSFGWNNTPSYVCLDNIRYTLE
jgi:hypothetical protein